MVDGLLGSVRLGVPLLRSCPVAAQIPQVTPKPIAVHEGELDRIERRMHGTSIYVWEDGKVVAKKP